MAFHSIRKKSMNDGLDNEAPRIFSTKKEARSLRNFEFMQPVGKCYDCSNQAKSKNGRVPHTNVQAEKNV